MRRRHDDHVRCRLPDRGLPRRIVLLQIPLEHHLLVMRMMLVVLMVLMVLMLLLNIRMIVLAATAHPNRNAPAEVLHLKLVAVPTPIERSSSSSSSALVMVVVMMVMFDLRRRRRYGGQLLLLLLGGGRRRLTWDSRRFVAERREAYTVGVGRLGHLVLEHGLEQGFPGGWGRRMKKKID